MKEIEDNSELNMAITVHVRDHIERALADCEVWKELNITGKVESLAAANMATCFGMLVADGKNAGQAGHVLRELFKRIRIANDLIIAEQEGPE